MPSFHVHGHTVRPDDVPPSPHARDTNYIYIQGNDHIDGQQKRVLQDDYQAKIQGYFGNHTYLCHYEPEDLERLRALPFILHANTMPREVKSTRSLQVAVDNTSSEAAKLKCDVTLHDAQRDSPASLADRCAQNFGISRDEISVCDKFIRLELPANHITELESLDSVRSIEPVYPVSIFNDIAREVIEADVHINGQKYVGEGQVVTVADTGFDLGTILDVHPAFTGRVLGLQSVGRVNQTNDWDGHGTHVCGSVLGNGSSVTMGGQLQGAAPGAQLAVQSLLAAAQPDPTRPALAPPADLKTLFNYAKTTWNSRVHTNSWGTPVDPNWVPGQLPGYDTQAMNIDEFVSNNPDMVILFAAGNDGRHANMPSQVIGPAAAKNSITVGASMSPRPSIDFVYAPQKTTTENPALVCSFSSKGPTVEGRIKPDIVAPGAVILSAASRDPTAMNSPRKNARGPSTDPLWRFDSGTSMATPLVAGCAAVMRQMLLSIGQPTPSAALVKALIINGANDLVDYGPRSIPATTTQAPNGAQGWGLVDLDGSVVLQGTFENAGFFQSLFPLMETGRYEKDIQITDPMARGGIPPFPVPNNGITLKVTLAYTDLPGPVIMNKLSLVVTNAAGTTKYGNEGQNGIENNVEQVTWRNVPLGGVKITVRGDRMLQPGSSQHFAVTWRWFRPGQRAE